MTIRNLRSIYMGGAALRALVSTVDGEEGAPGAAGGEPPAAAPAEPAPAEPAAEPPAGGEGAPAEPAAAAEEPPAAEPPKTTRRPWYEKRIDSLTAGKATAEEAAAAARREADEARSKVAAFEALYGKQDGTAAAPTAAPAPPADGRTYTAAEVHAEAQRIAQVTTLNQKLDGMFDAGVAKHGDDFKARVTQVQVAFGEDLKNRPDLFSALTELPNAADVYHELTGDLDRFEDVLAMSPVQLGMELARLSTKVGAKAKPPKVSGAPAPIEPLSGSGVVDSADLEKVDMNTYAKTREAQREARAKERGYI